MIFFKNIKQGVQNVDMSHPFNMSLQEFKEYVESRGVDFGSLTVEEKRVWSETFDKSRQGSLVKATDFIFRYFVLLFKGIRVTIIYLLIYFNFFLFL
jgi:hypothetical protein